MWEGVSTTGSSNLQYEMDFVLMDDGRWIILQMMDDLINLLSWLFYTITLKCIHH